MDVPNKTCPVWEELVTGRKVCRLRFLAAKILLGRLMRAVAENPAPDNVGLCASQLQAIYANNVDMPIVQDDLQTLCG